MIFSNKSQPDREGGNDIRKLTSESTAKKGPKNGREPEDSAERPSMDKS